MLSGSELLSRRQKMNTIFFSNALAQKVTLPLTKLTEPVFTFALPKTETLIAQACLGLVRLIPRKCVRLDLVE